MRDSTKSANGGFSTTAEVSGRSSTTNTGRPGPFPVLFSPTSCLTPKRIPLGTSPVRTEYPRA